VQSAACGGPQAERRPRGLPTRFGLGHDHLEPTTVQGGRQRETTDPAADN